MAGGTLGAACMACVMINKVEHDFDFERRADRDDDDLRRR
jgi:hypothetical protein